MTINRGKRFAAIAVSLLALMLAAPFARAVGIQGLKIPADSSGPAMTGAVWYPCAIAPTPMQLGPFTLFATRDCPINGTKLPLIVISHGRTGSFLGHRDTAQALAEAGFVVAAIAHPGDNAQDSSRSDDLSAFVERPADIKRLVDHLLGAWSGAAAIDPSRIGLFGFSRGGYTGLVIAGAEPHFDAAIGLCASQPSAICDQVRRGQPQTLVHDARIRAAVIADPLPIFFTRASMADVHIPIQLWRSERGGDGVAPTAVAALADWLPTKPEFRTVPKSQHFSFLPPCPPALAQEAQALCSDSPDFDRQAFHQELNASVVEFFRRTMP